MAKPDQSYLSLHKAKLKPDLYTSEEAKSWWINFSSVFKYRGHREEIFWAKSNTCTQLEKNNTYTVNGLNNTGFSKGIWKIQVYQLGFITFFYQRKIHVQKIPVLIDGMFFLVMYIIPPEFWYHFHIFLHLPCLRNILLQVMNGGGRKNSWKITGKKTGFHLCIVWKQRRKKLINCDLYFKIMKFFLILKF